MNLKKLFLMLTFFVLLGTTTFAANTWYVNAATGNDSYDGTQAAFSAGLVGPKATISAMLASAFVLDGDIISIASNTYNETVVVTKKNIQLLGTGGAVTIQNLTLNNSTGGTIGDGLQNIIVSGTLLLSQGTWTNSSLHLASGAVLNLAKGTFSASPTADGGAGGYDLVFSNGSAYTFAAVSLGTTNPRDITFSGTAAVTMPAITLTATRSVTISAGTSVVIGGNVLQVTKDFSNVGGYTTTAAGYVELIGSGNVSGNVTGTGNFMNLKTTGAITSTLTSNITFVNINATTNSTYTLGVGATLALSTFTLTTPGDIVDLSGAANITNGTGGTIAMNGSVTQNFQIVDGQTNTFGNFTINKPTGSILNFTTASNTVGTMGSYSFTKNFNFVSGQLETNFNNVVIGAGHGTSANVGGPINRNGTSTGVFSLVNTTNGVLFGGTGQINIPVVNASTGMTNEFTYLTAIGSDLTVTDGILKTASLTLVNGNVLVTNGGTLTMNGSTVSVTGNMTVGEGVGNTAGTITGTSNVTVSGAVSFVGTSATSKIDLTTAGSTPAGNLIVTGTLTDGAAGTSVRANTINVGTLTQTTGSTVTTLADLIVGAGGVTGSAAAVTVGGNFQSTGAVVFGAGNVAVTGTFTALSTVTTGVNGTVTVTGTGATTGAFTLGGTGLVWFKGNATFSAGVTTNAGGANSALQVDGTTSVTNIVDAARQVTVTLKKTASISGNVTFTSALSKILFGDGATITTHTIGGNFTSNATAAAVITLDATSTTKYANLKIAGNILFTGASSAAGAISMHANGTLTFNGSAAQTLTAVVNALAIAGTAEFANTLNTNQAARDASFSVAGGVNFVPANILLTTGGVVNTNLVLGAAGVLTVGGGYISNGAVNLTGGTYNLTFKNNNDWPLAVSAATPTSYELVAGVINLTLTTGYTGLVTLPAASNPTITGILSVTSGRTLALGANTLTVAKTTTGTNISVAGTVSGTGKVALTVPAAAVTIGGVGTMGNLDVNFGVNDQVVTLTGPATLSGNLLTSGGGNGTLTFGTGAFTTIPGTTTFNNKIINLPVTGLTLTGSFTHTAGAVTFPTGTGNLNLLAAANSINGGSYDFTTNTNVFGRLTLMGSVAQTVTLGGPITVDRVNINNAAGVTISAFTLTATDLLLTNGLLTHNGLLATTSITRSITATTNGQIATQPASGPTNVTYVGSANGSTGPELLGVLTTLTINSDIGATQTITLASGTTIVNGGTLNLSRGTLAAGTNLTFAAGTETVIRADGILTGTPAFNGTVNLQYLNSSAITTGAEWSSPTAVGTVLVNCLGTTVSLGQNSTATGLVTVSFGTLDLGSFTLTTGAGLTNNSSIIGTGTLANTAANTYTGTTLSWPNITTSANLTLNTTTATAGPPALTVTAASVAVTGGTLTLGGGLDAAGGFTVTGAFSVTATGGGFNDGGKNTYFKGNFTKSGTSTFTQGGTFTFNGATAQTITTNKNLGSVTVNNTAGITLGSNLTTANGSVLTLTAGNITTGANVLQIGATAVASIATPSATSYIIGNLNRYAIADYTVADAAGKYVFPLGTTDGKYRPVTLAFPSAATAGTGSLHIIKATHTNAAVTGTVGIPFTNGGVTINKLAPLYWTVGMYDAATGLVFVQPTSTATATDYPTITLGAGGVTFGDLTLTRAVYRLTNALNTWTVPGTPGVPYYDVNGVATVVHSGVQGWTTEPQELFAVGYASTFAVANALTAQTLIVGGTAYTKDVTVAPAVFGGAQGTLTYSVVSSDVTKATATITAAGVLTVTAVAEGTSTITVTATDVNGEQKTSAFVATIQAKPTFTLPTPATFTLAEAATTNNTVVFAASGTAGITYTMVPNTPALTWAAFDPATATLTLTPGYGVAAAVTGGIYTITVRATGTNGLSTDFVLTVTVTTTHRSPAWTGTGSATIATKSIKYNEVFNYSYVAVDPDGTVITYSLDSVTPATTAAVFTNNTGLGGFGQLVFTPTAADAGITYTIVVKALNANSLSSTTTTVLTVGVNHAPTFTKALVDSTVKVHNVAVPVVFQYVAADEDGDQFTFTLVSGKGSISATGLYTWTPVAADKGTTNTVKVRITDANNPLIYTETSAVLTVENVITSVESIDGVPTTFALAQNYPNPFNPSTNIQFSIPKSSNVKITVFNILGEEIATLVNSFMNAGNYKVTFNASNLPSGMYLYRIQSENFTQVKKMLLTK